jgi:hypothetical protein
MARQRAGELWFRQSPFAPSMHDLGQVAQENLQSIYSGVPGAELRFSRKHCAHSSGSCIQVKNEVANVPTLLAEKNAMGAYGLPISRVFISPVSVRSVTHTRHPQEFNASVSAWCRETFPLGRVATGKRLTLPSIRCQLLDEVWSGWRSKLRTFIEYL